MKAWITRVFTPNEIVPMHVVGFIIVAWTIVFLGWWNAAKPEVLPSPLGVINAFPGLWLQDGLGQEIISSLTVNLQALALSAAISLPLAYLSRIPFLRPLSLSVAKMRFVSPAVFFLPLLFISHSGHEVKVNMLTMGETFFLVTTMVGVVASIPEYQFDDARTLRMSPVASLWYVVVRGTLAQAIDAIRDNAAMGWSMLMMVEGVVRSEGGVGVLILNQEKHVNFAEVYAIALTIVIVGIAQDYVLGWTREAVCPWTT